MADLRGYGIVGRKSRKHWSAICEEWLLLVERYSRIRPSDACYWHTEMGNVGVLAGAAWRCGWIAATETQIEKKYQDGSSWGRADLQIACEGNYVEYIEAKYEWFVQKKESIVEVLKRGMENALEDARKIDGLEKTAVIFFTPHFSPKEMSTQNNFEHSLEEIISAARSMNTHISAWCFPETTRNLRSKGDGYAWPGVVMLANNTKFA